jgi:hypothetical protein
MVVRIRFGKRPDPSEKRRKKQRMAVTVAAFLTPAAVMAAALAAWGIAAGMNVAGPFAIPAGFFSHWQVWLAAAAALQICAIRLNRYARNRERAASASQ